MTVNIDRTLRRSHRVSKNIKGDADRPRIRIFRSNRYVYAQAIDDMTGQIIASSSSLILKKTDKDKRVKAEESKKVGEVLGQVLIKKGVKKGVFDRASYAYHGRVKSVAEGLRASGLII